MNQVGPLAGLPRRLKGKESTCQCRRLLFDPGLGGSPREGNAIHSSILAWEIPWTEDSGWATVHGVAKSQA